MENKLDRYFRENLQDREFGFDEAWWAGAEKLLDTERRRKRRRLFAWWFAGAAGVAIALAGWWFWGEIPGAGNDKNLAENATQPAMENPVKTDFDQKNQPAQVSETGSENENTPQATQPATQNLKDKKFPDNQPAASGNTLSNPVSSFEKTGAKPQVKAETGVVEISENEAAGLAAATPTPSGTEAAAAETSEPLSTSPEIARRTTGLNRLSLLTTFVRGDFSKKLNVHPIAEAPATASKWRAGVTAAQLLQTGSGERVIGFRAGLALRYDFSKNWFLATGLQYHRRSGTFDISKAAEGRRYRFGLEVDSFLLQPSSLHYVSLPVSVGWQRGRHVTSAGLLLDYLAGIRGARGRFEKTDDLPPRKEFQADETGWLAEDGYKKTTATAQLSYHYRVNRQLSFGLSANYTFGGILEKNYQPPVGGFLLKEASKFYLGLEATYFIK